MATNPYNYDTTVPWIPQQNQQYEGREVTARTNQQLSDPQNQRPQQRGGVPKPRAPEKMPKARALALARTLKRWLVVASIVGFGTFGGLVSLHQVGTTASQSTQSSSGSSQTTSSSNSSSQNSNSFLNQQGGTNFGSSNSSQGSASGSSVS